MPAKKSISARNLRRESISSFKRNPEIEKIAASCYSEELAYHNFNHIREVLESAEILLKRCEDHGIAVNAETVYYAVLFHDAGYHEDHRALGFTCKEEYSAQIAEKVLRKLGFDEARVTPIREAILATKKGSGPAANEEIKVVRASDLARLAAEYSVFMSNTRKLKDEYERISKRSVPWQQWREMAARDVEDFLNQDFFAPPGPVSLLKEFKETVQRNLVKLRAESKG